MKTGIYKGIIVLLLLALVGGNFLSCDSLTHEKVVNAQSIFTDHVLEISIRNRQNTGDYLAYGNSVFYSKASIQDMIDALQTAYPDAVAETYSLSEVAYDFGAYFRLPYGDQYEYYILGFMGNAEHGKQYLLAGMGAELIGSADDSKLLIPLYAIKDKRIKAEIAPRVVLDVEYELGNELTLADNYVKLTLESAADLFCDFYRSSGWYDVEKENSHLYISFEEDAIYKITFSEKHGQLYFLVTESI